MHRILIYKDQILKKSRLQVGVTLTQHTPEKTWMSTLEARDRASKHISAMPNAIYNVHAFGFGCTPEIVDQNFSTWNWKDLDARMNWLKSCGVKNIMLTFYGAPSWMTETVDNLRYARIKPEYNLTFAGLCESVLNRYQEYPVAHVQIWNEGKGYGKQGSYWNESAYTELYNAVYNTIRMDSSYDHIKIGGPYILLSSPFLEEYDYNFLTDWKYAASGADFVCASYSLSELRNTPLSNHGYMQMTNKFNYLVDWLKSEFPGLEVCMSENYWWSALDRFHDMPVDFQGACTASIYLHEIENCSASLFWGLQGDGRYPDDGVQGSWLVDTRGAWGGAPASRFLPGDKSPNYDAAKIFHDYFPPGTDLVYTESSDPMIEVLASPTHFLLINKNEYPVEVWVNQRRFRLAPYQFSVFDSNYF